MRINPKQRLKDLAGRDQKITSADGDEFLTVGKTVAGILNNHKVGGKMKLYTLAQKFYDEKPFDIDKADIALVKDAIEVTQVYTNNVITGQLLLILSELKDE